jgi:dihydroneopterin aldolase
MSAGTQILTLTGLRFDANLGILIDECTAEHVNLLESLIGKLAHRLMQLPGVLGVRVKIAKLEIFDDCEVAIRVETGQW